MADSMLCNAKTLKTMSFTQACEHVSSISAHQDKSTVEDFLAIKALIQKCPELAQERIYLAFHSQHLPPSALDLHGKNT
jgi:hypothetical protein